MIDNNILEKLNNKQREAVFATEGYVRVIAGAGSGKTKLLVSRYAYLVQDYGIDSANILCVTFTNKAAGEMKKRIRSLIGEGNDTSLICTYHGFCNRLLRENPEKLFLNKQFQIIDSYQQKTILTEIYQKHELQLDYASFESMLHKLAAYKSKPGYVNRICNPKPCQIMDKIECTDDEILEEFMQRQKATYSLDFHDLIAFAIYVLENNDDVRTKWQERLNYIMVDEFQDSSSVEMKLIEILSAQYKNLLIVGDPDQNIYEWRGSDVKLLVDFDKTHLPTQTIILNQNYRSTPEILRCANTLIEKNSLRLKKDLFTENPNGAEVIHYHSKNDFAEMDQIIDLIKQIKESESYKYSDFAILYRSCFLSRIAEKKLVERNVPYEIFGGVKFYQRMEILDVLAYLKLIAFDDDTSFKRIINTPRRRFGRNKLGLLESIRDGLHDGYEQLSFDEYELDEDRSPVSGRRSLFSALKANLREKDFANSDAKGFINLIDGIRAKKNSMRISEIVNEVASESGYERYIRELGDEERLDNLAEFKRIANEFEREFGENVSLEEFLQQIALQSGEDSEEMQDAVKMMTIHAAKGLEFPVVFILGFTEGIFPSSKTIEERKVLGLEEERRLCYVAITRAEKYLYLFDSEGVSPKGIKKLSSRFLDEIGANNYSRIGKIPEELQYESRRNIERINSELAVGLAMDSQDKRIGDVVHHHIFGPGKIVGIDERRGGYVVKFDSLVQPRNISKTYFNDEHRDARVFYPEKTAVVAPVPEVDESDDDRLDRKPKTTEAEEAFSQSSCVDIEDGEVINDTENENPNDVEAFDLKNYGYTDYDNKIQEKMRLAREKAKDSPNLWKRDDVPHSGWSCVGIEDLEAPVGICEMCGYQIIRYAHHMEHPGYRGLICGCVCAGKMEGNIEEAKRREAEYKNMQARRISFFKRKWKHSQKGNDYLKIDDHVVIIYKLKGENAWKYSVDNVFSKTKFSTKESAMASAFEQLEKVRNTAR